MYLHRPTMCLTFFMMSAIFMAQSTAATVITLVKDIRHTDLADHFKLRTSDKLVISSSLEKSLIVPQGSTWDLSSYTSIEFTGNARLVCEPGSRLHGAGGVLRFRDESRFIVGKE